MLWEEVVVERQCPVGCITMLEGGRKKVMESIMPGFSLSATHCLGTVSCWKGPTLLVA